MLRTMTKVVGVFQSKPQVDRKVKDARYCVRARRRGKFFGA
jgi:hypothetical protein